MADGLHRVGAIGDIHTEDEFLAAAIAHLQAEGVDRLCSVGDIVDRGQGDADACCTLLREHDVLTVRGNHDRWLVDGTMRDLPDVTHAEDVTGATMDYLSGLPATRDLQTVAGPLLLCHGIADNDMSRVGPDDHGYAIDVNEDLQDLMSKKRYRFVIGGHTHYRMVRAFGAVTIINAGTLYRRHDPCFVLVDFDAGSVQFYDFDSSGRVLTGETAAL